MHSISLSHPCTYNYNYFNNIHHNLGNGLGTLIRKESSNSFYQIFKFYFSWNGAQPEVVSALSIQFRKSDKSPNRPGSLLPVHNERTFQVT